MKEIQLVGVNHGLELIYGFGFTRHFEVTPPVDFVEQLGLPASSTVAIESLPGREHLAGQVGFADEDYLAAKAMARGQRYFGAAALLLSQAGHEVVGIDDERLRQSVYPRYQVLLEQEDVLEYIHGPEMSWKIQRRLDFSKAFIGHMDSTIREELMFDKLATGRFDAAIIGQDHADVLASDIELQDRLGLSVVEYLRGGVEFHGRPIDEHNLPGHTEAVDGYLYQPDKDEVARGAHESRVDRELYRRRYNAFSIGRILGRKQPKPDFLGRFYISDQAETSLFEVHLTERDGNEFRGTVYDVLGDAAISGTFSDGSIEFVKEYDLSTTPHTDFQKLYYHGNIIPDTGNVNGYYDLEPTSKYGYAFVMTPFEKYACKKLNSYDVISPEQRLK